MIKNYFSPRFFCTIWNASLDSISSIPSTRGGVQSAVDRKIQENKFHFAPNPQKV